MERGGLASKGGDEQWNVGGSTIQIDGMRRAGRECLYLQIVYVQNIHSTCTSLKENKKQDKTNIHVHVYTDT